MLFMLNMFIFFILISLILILINLFISTKKINYREKLTPFECGFDPLSQSRLPFSMQFFMISIIFLIFDIEIIIFLPMITSFFNSNLNNWLMTTTFFIFILLTGLYMEWMEGALYWLK